MITSSLLKDGGFVGSKFLSVTPHKSFWPVNENIVRGEPLRSSPRDPVEGQNGPGQCVRITWEGGLDRTGHSAPGQVSPSAVTALRPKLHESEL